MYIYIYIYSNTYVHTYMCIYTSVCVYIYGSVCVCVCVFFRDVCTHSGVTDSTTTPLKCVSKKIKKRRRACVTTDCSSI